MSRKELLGKITDLLGGRAAEELVFGDVSTGAANDLEKDADIVRNMLTVYGMSERMPNRSLVDKTGALFLGAGPSTRRRSETLEAKIDSETQAIIDNAYRAARKILAEHRSQLEAMAAMMLEKEKIDSNDIHRILWPARKAEDAATGPRLAAAH